MFRLKSSVVIAHITGWLICLGLPLLFISRQTGHHNTLVILLSAAYLVLLVTYAALFYLHARRQQSEQKALYAETRRTQAELSFLKAQINPHFLFNTLNNIYSLAIMHSENTAMSIMQFSNMLRYVTEYTKDDYVLLESEINCLRDYVDLQKLRLTTKTRVNFSVTGSPGIRCIAPLLLLPFLENAFKYGVSSQEPSEINILLDTSGNHIHFYCSNKLFRISPDNTSTGIGITNTRQRLDHLYPDKYELQISKDNGVYIISLQLQV